MNTLDNTTPGRPPMWSDAPGTIPTLSRVGPCEAIGAGHEDGATLRTLTPWPGLKTLTSQAVGS